MQTLSATLQAAIANGNPQRALFEFIKDPDGTEYSPHVFFTNEDIMVNEGVRLTQEFNHETDIAIGLTPSAQIRFEMLNDASQLADFEFGTFKAYLGARIDSGTPEQGAVTRTFTEGGKTVLYEFSPLGVFVTQRPDVVMSNTIDVDANDQMTLFDVDMPDDLTLTYPTTLYGIASAMCQYVGVTLSQQSWLNSTLTVTSKPDQFDGATMRDVLGWIAEAACGIARFTRDGQLEFVWFTTVNKVYDEHNYTEFAAAWYETKAIDGLHIRNSDQTAEFVIDTDGDENAYLIQDNPFLHTGG